MERRTILKVNINCLRISRTVRQETLQTSRSEVHYQYAHNTINFSESTIVVSGQSGVSIQASELINEPEEVRSDRDEDSKTVIFISDDELTDKNDDELTDKNDDEIDSITEENHKCNHDDNQDSDFSDASTVVIRSIQNFSFDEDECSKPKIIQMAEVTSTEQVNDIAEYSPDLPEENHLNNTEVSLLEERPLSYSPALFEENHLDTTEASLLEERKSLQYSPALFQENHLDTTQASLLEERSLSYSPALFEENHLDTTEVSLLEERRSLDYSPALFQENNLDTTEASLLEEKKYLEYSPALDDKCKLYITETSLPEESRSSEYSSDLDVKTQLDTAEASLPEVKKFSGKPKIIADEILLKKVFVCRSADIENLNANVDMTNVINNKFLDLESNERENEDSLSMTNSLVELEDFLGFPEEAAKDVTFVNETRDVIVSVEGNISNSLNTSTSSELEDFLGFSREAAKDVTFANETKDVTVGVEGNISNSLNTSTSSELEDFLGFSREAAKDVTFANETKDVTVGVEGNINNSLNTSTSSGQSENFLGFPREAAKGFTLTNEPREIIFGTEGNINNSLNMSTSSGQSENFLEFPREASLENLSNFQDLIENVKCDPVTYKFASIIRDTSNCVRPESPSYSYLRNNLPDQVESLVTVVSPKNYIKSSILPPIFNLKSSGYLDLIPDIKKLTTLDNKELNKLQRSLRSKRYRMIKKAKLKLKTNSSKKSSKKSQEEKKKFKAPKSVWASPKLKRASKQIGKVSTDYFSDRVKTRRMFRESKCRERERKIALLGRTDSRHKTRTFSKVSNNSLKVEETPKAISHILRSRKLNFTDCENGQSNVTKSVVSPLPGGVVLKELRVNLTPVSISSFKKNFENKKQISDSIFDSSLVPETNANFGNEFEEYEHLKYSDNKSIKDSTADSQFTEESSFEEKRSFDSDIHPHKKAINFRRSDRIRNRAQKRQSYLTRSRDGILKRHQSQVRKVSKKVTFSKDIITVHHI